MEFFEHFYFYSSAKDSLNLARNGELDMSLLDDSGLISSHSLLSLQINFLQPPTPFKVLQSSSFAPGKHQSPSIQAEAQQKHNASRNNRRILYFFKQYHWVSAAGSSKEISAPKQQQNFKIS